MKHIIIAGSARSGKTTLSHMLKERFPFYNEFHGDCIRAWIIALYGKKRAAEITHSERYADAMIPLIRAILDDAKYPYIVEWSRLYPSSTINTEYFENCDFIYLGHGNLSAEALMKQCRYYETPKDFTAALSDAQLKLACERWAAVDARMLDECKQFNMRYYTTSTNRNDVLETIVEQITRNI